LEKFVDKRDRAATVKSRMRGSSGSNSCSNIVIEIALSSAKNRTMRERRFTVMSIDMIRYRQIRIKDDETKTIIAGTDDVEVSDETQRTV
jgi:hypothetical protein